MKRDFGIIINIGKESGSFAENKDLAKRWRERDILPALAKHLDVVLNFEGVEYVTQSFVHALISKPLQQYGEPALKRLVFKKCVKEVKQIILTVIEYSLEGVGD